MNNEKQKKYELTPDDKKIISELKNAYKEVENERNSEQSRAIKRAVNAELSKHAKARGRRLRCEEIKNFQ